MRRVGCANWGIAALSVLVVLVCGCLGKPIGYADYPEVLQRLGALVANDLYNMFSLESYGGATFPAEQQTCRVGADNDRETCQYLNLKITNFNFTSEEVSSMPQILLVGGFFGDDSVGTTALLELAEYLVRFKDQNQHILNSMVLHVIPVANPLGFSDKNANENNIVTITDFPFYYSETSGSGNTGPCMTSNSARFINEVIRKVQFTSAILLSQSSADLTKLSRILGITKLSQCLCNQERTRSTLLTNLGCCESQSR